MKRMIGFVLVIILLASSLSACATGKAAYDASKIDGSVVEANGKFAFDIFKKLNTEDHDKSVFISPLSISTALAMTYNGAESTTKEAMAKVLGVDDMDRDAVNAGFRDLLYYLENADEKVELNISNSIWIREGEKINESFISNNKSNFNAEVSGLDFSKKSSADTINKWISDATKGKIDKMLEPPINPDVLMYLINAIYFKGQWSEQFDPAKTVESTFNSLDGKEQQARMMSRKGKVLYNGGDDYSAVKLPYGSGNTSMYCILPKEGMDINGFIEGMSFEKWNDIKKNISEVDEVKLQIPRFKLEYGIKNLNECLKTLGMGEAFTDKADFTGIREDICISRVLHKAVIEVNEEGSEAAAATVVEMKLTSAMEPVEFIADRPFMFVIADDATGTILFMGKLADIE